MAFTINRSQLIQRVRIVAHEPADSGPYTDSNIAAHLQYALEEMWSDLTASEDGAGRVHENFTIATGDPSGYVPGQSIPLPDYMATLVAVRRNGVRLTRGTPDRREFTTGTVGGVSPHGLKYWIDGPNQSITPITGVPVLTAATLLVTPDFVEGETVEWLYIQRPPHLWNPFTAESASGEVTVDLLEASIVHAIVALAVAGATSRGDTDAWQRAKTEAQRVIAAYFKRAHDRDRGTQVLSDFANERDGVGWWR